jgi:heparan-alpha-glucosaminide N-acetyltransferase
LEKPGDNGWYTVSTATQTSALAGEQVGTKRLAAVDILRGLTMVVMIFVNDLASVRGLPWWNYHMRADVNFMTYVDMVYPFFLFVVGLSIPLAFRQRLKKASLPKLWWHVFLRSLSLIVLGLILANAEKADPARMGINPNAWAILALAGAVLYLSIYKGSDNYSTLHFWLRMLGVAVTITMLAVFRRTASGGHAAWIDSSYPEILGLIGYTYFAVSILYIPTRRWVWAPCGWFLALLLLNVFCAAKPSAFVAHLPLYLWPFGNGAMASITMAGVVTSLICFVDHPHQTPRRKIFFALGFAVAALAAGWFLAPLGISKIRATPTWNLYSIGAAVLLVAALYWIGDVEQHTAWAFFARPAGANTLLTYLLPDFYYFGLAWAGVSYFKQHLNAGWPGAVRSAAFTGLILALAALLTKLRVRLQL